MLRWRCTAAPPAVNLLWLAAHLLTLAAPPLARQACAAVTLAAARGVFWPPRRQRRAAAAAHHVPQRGQLAAARRVLRRRRRHRALRRARLAGRLPAALPGAGAGGPGGGCRRRRRRVRRSRRAAPAQGQLACGGEEGERAGQATRGVVGLAALSGESSCLSWPTYTTSPHNCQPPPRLRRSSSTQPLQCARRPLPLSHRRRARSPLLTSSRSCVAWWRHGCQLSLSRWTVRPFVAPVPLRWCVHCVSS